MPVTPLSAGSTPALPSSSTDRIRSPEEAARTFEEVLVRQFVQVMTDEMFDQSLAGDDGPGWMQGQADVQRDALTDVLTRQLVDQDAFGLSELIARSIRVRQEASDATGGATPPDSPASRSASS